MTGSKGVFADRDPEELSECVHSFVCSFLQPVRRLWNAHFLSGTTLVSNVPSAHFLPLCTKLRCSGVTRSRVMMKEENKYFREPL